MYTLDIRASFTVAPEQVLYVSLGREGPAPLVASSVVLAFRAKKGEPALRMKSERKLAMLLICHEAVWGSGDALLPFASHHLQHLEELALGS